MVWNASQYQGWTLTEAKLSCDTGAAKWPLVDWCMSTVRFWATLLKSKAEYSWATTFLKTGHWLPWWRVVTSSVSVPGPNCFFFSLLPSGHFYLFSGPSPEIREKKNTRACSYNHCRKVWLSESGWNQKIPVLSIMCNKLPPKFVT